MTTYYAIADLHGRFDLLERAFDKIKEVSSGAYKIITLGDYIDRGPQSKEIIDYLMYRVGHDLDDNELICLKGNHEDMMVQSVTTLPSIDWWLGNGGDATLRSYNAEPGFTFGNYYEARLQQGVVPDEHVKWMANLPIYFETEKQLFVHAGVPQSEMNLPPKHVDKYQDMMWMLYNRNTAGGWKGKHVVHGHHQFADGPHVWHGTDGGRTDLDTFAWNTGRLVIGVFDDTQGSALEFIEITDDKYTRSNP